MSTATPRRRRLLAHEVVQTSSMDCGPATLKCLLEGHHIPASYGRLREACQTDVDGTSIDTLEQVAQQLGLAAEQSLLPLDHVLLPGAQALPAVVVVRQADSATHFVVVWRQAGAWLQVMDPALGRRWVRGQALLDELYRHTMPVPALDWRQWAGSPGFTVPLQERMALLGLDQRQRSRLLARALADAGWFPIAALDASVRLVQALQQAGGLRHRREAAALVASLFKRTCADGEDIHRLLPPAYWSATPDASNTDPSRQMLSLHGAVVLTVRGRRADAAGAADGAGAAHATRAANAANAANAEQTAEASANSLPPLSPELRAALAEPPAAPGTAVWRLLRQDGLLAPLALLLATLLASAVTTLEALLFRGLFDMADTLVQPQQRLLAGLALLAFLAVLLAIELPIVHETLRQGRQLEARLRMALLRKLPRLTDRYFQSRPVSDMAERAHAIVALRELPALGLHGLQTGAELLLTLLGIGLIAPASLGAALLLALLAVALPLLAQPFLNERELRVRNQAAALNGFYLDALLGLVPVRAHQAQHNVRRQHEGLLVGWAASARGWVQGSLAADGLQSLVCTTLAGGLLLAHFARAGGVGGADLLLVYWTLKLPATGARLADLAQDYPAQRNALLRLLEPLSAPEASGEPMSARGNPTPASGAQRQAPVDRPTAPAAPSPVPPNRRSMPASAGSVHAAHTTSLALAQLASRAARRRPRGVAIDIRGGSVLAAGHGILHQLNLQIAPGEHVAVVGASGAGKSSLVGLLLGWHRLAEGELRVNGQPLTSRRGEALRRVTAWVDPGVQLWNQSLLDNLAYATAEPDLARVGDVVASARLRGLLEQLPDGLQTLLGEGGGLLSGGEGQRVRLGRALMARGARLALLDEPFRGLDRPQRRDLLAEARHWWRHSTLLCVSHDLAETQDFDRVLVVDQGRIVADGAPGALAQQPGAYRDLLDAEARLRSGLWQAGPWRRLWVAGGRVIEPALLR